MKKALKILGIILSVILVLIICAILIIASIIYINNAREIYNDIFAEREGNWVYYAESQTGIYKTNGIIKLKINNKGSTIVKISDGWIYYQCGFTPNEGVYKMRTNGKDVVKLSNSRSILNVLDISEGLIVYTNRDDKGCLYAIGTDGTNNTKLSDDYAMNARITGDRVYYSMPNGVWDYDIYKIKLNGEEKTKIATIDDKGYFTDDFIYYGGKDNNLYRIRIDGTDKKLLFENNTRGQMGVTIGKMSINKIKFVDNYIYFKLRTVPPVAHQVEFEGYTYRMLPDGKELTQIEHKKWVGHY